MPLVARNGRTRNGRQSRRCRDRGRRFVLDPRKRRLGDEVRRTVERLLPERLSLAGITRATGVGLS